MKTQPLKALPFNRRTAPGTPADVYLRGRRGHDGATGVAKRTPAAHSRYMAAGIRAATLQIRTQIVATHYPPLLFLLASIPFFAGLHGDKQTAVPPALASWAGRLDWGCGQSCGGCRVGSVGSLGRSLPSGRFSRIAGNFGQDWLALLCCY